MTPHNTLVGSNDSGELTLFSLYTFVATKKSVEYLKFLSYNKFRVALSIRSNSNSRVAFMTMSYC